MIDAFREELGDEAIGDAPQVMAGEDFSRYGLEGIPAVIYWVGGPSADTLERAAAGEIPAPSLHRPDFAPDPRPSLRTAVRAHVAAYLEIAGGLQ